MLTKIRSYVLILFFASYVAGLTVIAIVLGSFITVTSVSHAQMFPNIQNANTVTTNPALTLPEREHLVKIISPIKGQQVPVGKDLTISGTSADNTRSSDCKVSVIVNGDKPYRNAYPIGQAGSGDNSKWNFTLTPSYPSIKQGQNKITAKFSCSSDPNLISHNSVNVTGVARALTSISKQHQQEQHQNKNPTSKKLAIENNNNDDYNHPLTIISIPHPHNSQIKIPFHLPFH